ncbi:MAG: hypothetical protein KDH20_18230 [Rhodocyclaceae bacterium]|nr:hypothetical protein [Rhodocyclaceae bacterium]
MNVERAVALATIVAVVSGCALERAAPPPGVEEPDPPVIVEQASPVLAADVNLRAILAFYRKSRGMSRAELIAERKALEGSDGRPLDELRLAMLLGQERSDLVRALGLLDAIARSDNPQALALQPLARLLSDQYAERLKLETQSERLGVNIRDAEKRAAAATAQARELQEKIDALAEIERNLPGRPAPPVPTGGTNR